MVELDSTHQDSSNVKRELSEELSQIENSLGKASEELGRWNAELIELAERRAALQNEEQQLQRLMYQKEAEVHQTSSKC